MHNMVKNPHWPGAKQLRYLQAWSRSYTRKYREQIQLVVRAGIEFGALGSQQTFQIMRGILYLVVRGSWSI